MNSHHRTNVSCYRTQKLVIVEIYREPRETNPDRRIAVGSSLKWKSGVQRKKRNRKPLTYRFFRRKSLIKSSSSSKRINRCLGFMLLRMKSREIDSHCIKHVLTSGMGGRPYEHLAMMAYSNGFRDRWNSSLVKNTAGSPLSVKAGGLTPPMDILCRLLVDATNCAYVGFLAASASAAPPLDEGNISP